MRKRELQELLSRTQQECAELGFAIPHLVALGGELHAYGICSTCDRLGCYTEQPGRPPTIRFNRIYECWSLPGNR